MRRRALGRIIVVSKLICFSASPPSRGMSNPMDVRSDGGIRSWDDYFDCGFISLSTQQQALRQALAPNGICPREAMPQYCLTLW